MKFGLDVGVYGRLATPENIIPLAELADSAGFDSVWLADHVVFPVDIQSRYPYNPTGQFPVPGSEPLLEPIATMGVLAGATKHVKIGTAVLVMPYRNPVVLAKMLTTYDVFTGGRIILGAGVGWLEEEFHALDARAFSQEMHFAGCLLTLVTGDGAERCWTSLSDALGNDRTGLNLIPEVTRVSVSCFEIIE